MRKTIFILLSSMVLISGCQQSRYLTEKYIKTNIENHKDGEFSTIKILNIYQQPTADKAAYIELTGYKYENAKGLVIGVDKYFLAKQRFKGDRSIVASTTYIELGFEQCKAIVTNYKILLDKISKEDAKANEEIYHDYTVSKDLFISYKKSPGNSLANISLWIKGEKYLIPTSKFIRKLNKFIQY